MPYPNNHACMIDDSLKTVGTQTRDHKGKKYLVHIGKKPGGDGSGERSYLYPTKEWTATEAQAHCKSHGGTFEKATGNQTQQMIDPADNPMLKTEEET